MNKEQIEKKNLVCAEDYISNSSMSTFRQCSAKFDFQYRQKITRMETNIALYLGQVIHKALEYYYGVGERQAGNTLDLFVSAFDGGLGEVVPKYSKDVPDAATGRSLGYAMLDTYFSGTFLEDTDWEVLATEQDMEAEIDGVKYVAIIDMIIRSKQDGKIYIVDHKTAARKPDEDYLSWDNQLTGYIWVARQNGYDAVGGIYNYLFKYKKPLWARYKVWRTDEQIEDFVRELRTGLKNIKTTIPSKNLSSECPRRCEYWQLCQGNKEGYLFNATKLITGEDEE